jgi:hypothetical protein
LRAGRILRLMGWEQKADAIAAEYAAGRDVTEIERQYGLTPEESAYLEATGRPWEVVQQRGLQIRGNRILLGIGIGFVVSSFAGLLGATGGAALFLWVVTAAIAYPLLTSYAGTLSSRHTST